MAEAKDIKKIRICKVQDCENPSRIRGMCNSCYSKAKRRGEFGHQKCKVDECGDPSIYRDGLCNRHHIQIKRHGMIMKTTRDPNDFVINLDSVEVVLRDSYCEKIGSALIDHDDVKLVKNYKWHIEPHGYVATQINGSRTYLHKLLTEGVPGYIVDHINRNKLDNRRSNLRLVSPRQNTWNRKVQSNNKSGIKGVHFTGTKWAAKIAYNGKHRRIGLYDDPMDAAKAYDNASVKYHKEFGATNKELGYYD